MCVYVLVHMPFIYIRADIKTNSYNAVVKSEGRKYNLDASLFHPKNRFYSLFLKCSNEKGFNVFQPIHFIKKYDSLFYSIDAVHSGFIPPKIRSNNNFSIIERLC